MGSSHHPGFALKDTKRFNIQLSNTISKMTPNQSLKCAFTERWKRSQVIHKTILTSAFKEGFGTQQVYLNRLNRLENLAAKDYLFYKALIKIKIRLLY